MLKSNKLNLSYSILEGNQLKRMVWMPNLMIELKVGMSHKIR